MKRRDKPNHGGVTSDTARIGDACLGSKRAGPDERKSSQRPKIRRLHVPEAPTDLNLATDILATALRLVEKTSPRGALTHSL